MLLDISNKYFNQSQNSIIYFEKKKFKKALQEIDLAINIEKKYEHYLLKSEILIKLKNYDEGSIYFNLEKVCQI
jgi:hypothetical protein